MTPGREFTQEDCRLLIDSLVKIFKKSGFDQEVDFLVYGSYFENWRDGLSDLDATLYFSQLPPTHPANLPKIKKFQGEMAKLFEELPYLKRGNYFADVFIFDCLHAADGRFVIHDRYFVKSLFADVPYKVMHGSLCMHNWNLISLRHQYELWLGFGLHRLRNYLLFEIPLSPDVMSITRAKEVLKFFRVLPRMVTLLLDRPMAKCLGDLTDIDLFNSVDFTPYVELWNKTLTRLTTDNYLHEWHEPNNDSFVKCWECYEKALMILVERVPMKSQR